jgi:hypothetical protein
MGTRGRENGELILHSNGGQLSVVPTHQPGNSSGLSDISAGPKKTALATGSYTTGRYTKPSDCKNIRYHGLVLVAHVHSIQRIDDSVAKATCTPPGQPG